MNTNINAKVIAVAPEIPDYQLECDDVFACPALIDRRVDFWINVFQKWKKQNRVLHDSRQPERVYAVLDTKDECRRKNPKGEVKSALNSVKKQLDSLVNLIEGGASEQKLSKHPYYRLFKGSKLNYIKEAKDSIRCQTGNKEMFEEALINYQIFRPYIVSALKAQDLPIDIQYLPFVESSFNPKAYSYAGAAGMWQIMPQTARSLGLQLGSSVDERMEPEFATLAAAKYFRNSIDRLSNTAKEGGHSIAPKNLNPFVITSYNYGVRGMQRAINQVGTDYEKLLKEYKSGSFQIAVRNFYASFLAARHVAKNRASFFPDIATPKPAQTLSRIAIPKSLFSKQIIDSLKISKTELQELNPGLTYRVWRNQTAVPTGYILKVPYKPNGWEVEIANMNKYSAVSTGKGDSGGRHKVRRGQTACGIAESYKVRCRDLISLNGLNKKAVIKIGQNLKIPGGVQKYRITNIAKASQDLREQLAIKPVQFSLPNNQQDNTLSVNSASDIPTENPAQALQEEQTPAAVNPPAQSDARNIDLNAELSATPNVPQPSVNADTVSNENSSNTDLTKIINLDTGIKQKDNKLWVLALPSESIGLYADWLGVGTTRSLRQQNNLKARGDIDVFQRIYLPDLSEQQKAQFILSRNEYHVELQLQYFQRFQVTQVVKRPMKSSETLWSIAKNNRLPMWLAMQYNADIKPGKTIHIPIVKPR